MKSNADYPLVIIGAGAAGLGASEAATANKIDHIVLESSHRTGGRGLTEYLEESIPVDLGCHWMHSASKNPYVDWADKLGFEYENLPYEHAMHFNGEWLNPDQVKNYDQFVNESYSVMEQSYQQSPANAVIDSIDPDSQWTSQFYYWMSAMHSNDPDQVSVQDVAESDDTNEDWPVKNGYGALIVEQGKNCPVKLNSEVTEINWGASPVKITTNSGAITADKVIISVSTGVLNSGSIKFFPELPAEKTDAIATLPMGNYNYQFFSCEPGTFDSDTPENIEYNDGEVAMYIKVGQFGFPTIYTFTVGRFAWWLENQGSEASKAYFEDALVKIFGSQVRKGLREFKVSAWGYDPWVRGAYSSQKSGYSGMRKQLGTPIDQCLYFAGEATSTDFLNTAHGAYLSGKRAVIETLD